LVRNKNHQNGIFIDLGNIVPVQFSMKGSADELLLINKKDGDFLQAASLLLFERHEAEKSEISLCQNQHCACF